MGRLRVLKFAFFPERRREAGGIESARAESGKEHWVGKGRENVRLFLWQKLPAAGAQRRGTVLFVHGSSMASQPTFDLKVPGRPDSSVMDWFAARGVETRCMDNDAYGRSH